MLGIVVSLGPVVAFGAFAAWADARSRKLKLVDLTDVAPVSKRHARKKPVDAVVLHQTGFSRGTDPSRYHNVTAHFVVLEDGAVVQLHPLTARLSASDGFNSRSVSIEFVGNFRSSRGQWWQPEKYGRNTPTAEQIQAGRRLLRLLRDGGLGYVFAHRQSSSSRGNDPGPEIWQGVGQWAVSSLGMSDGGAGFAIGDGAPLPDVWR
ncbi:N-acetylmuramoyl-L-alanine amidase [Pseudenhygromyxa sp. WMMC2535]|uniref:peptidoglycan recognition protein family protein n=1 Tax=Pseudenhygromyxa sp. WMMC2535 TaxID=2712867 RepID=UPI001553355D|nr:peptidoglycan recognition family protein [Pseudenhygromyxa sp. WMMC2535]NVB40329.1 N-acetylmuramoyl-L-alanine amidase [Pseudenhygromyxa sp. WMMC2535]